MRAAGATVPPTAGAAGPAPLAGDPPLPPQCFTRRWQDVPRPGARGPGLARWRRHRCARSRGVRRHLCVFPRRRRRARSDGHRGASRGGRLGSRAVRSGRCCERRGFHPRVGQGPRRRGPGRCRVRHLLRRVCLGRRHLRSCSSYVPSRPLCGRHWPRRPRRSRAIAPAAPTATQATGNQCVKEGDRGRTQAAGGAPTTSGHRRVPGEGACHDEARTTRRLAPPPLGEGALPARHGVNSNGREQVVKALLVAPGPGRRTRLFQDPRRERQVPLPVAPLGPCSGVDVPPKPRR